MGAPVMKAPLASLAGLSLLGLLTACSDLAAPVDPRSAAGSHSGGQAASHAGASSTGDPNGGATAQGGSGSASAHPHAGASAKAGNAGTGGSEPDPLLALT